VKKYIHNPNFRFQYPGKEAYLFSEGKQNSGPWQHPDYKKREFSPGPVNFIPDRDHDEKPDEPEEKEELCRD
jgi:hypothetical protein